MRADLANEARSCRVRLSRVVRASGHRRRVSIRRRRSRMRRVRLVVLELYRGDRDRRSRRNRLGLVSANLARAPRAERLKPTAVNDRV